MGAKAFLGMARCFSMKGSEWLYNVYINTFVVLIIVVVGSTLLLSGVETASKNEAQNMADNIAGIINIMQTSPVDLEYGIETLKRCTIDVNENFVKVTVKSGSKPFSAGSGIISSPLTVVKSKIECDGSLTIEKDGTSISFR